jgi:hypothetical protein
MKKLVSFPKASVLEDSMSIYISPESETPITEILTTSNTLYSFGIGNLCKECVI